MKTWKTSVDELISIFRTALVALLPSMEKAHIAWREGEAYDDWDEITQSLYRNIVGRSLQSVFDNDFDLDDLLPKYNMKLLSYKERHILKIARSAPVDSNAFVGLSSTEEPFDTVDFICIDSKGEPRGNILRIPLEKASFEFLYWSRKEPKVITDLDVDL